MRGILLVAAFLIACSGACSGASPPPASSTAPPPPPPPPPNGEHCPAAFAQAGGDCDPAAHPGTCAYAEGSCYCGATIPCSGAARSDEELAAMPSSWQCTAVPPRVRPDGCPGMEPNAGTACSPSGRTCTYGSCCVRHFRCEKGRWKDAGGECPP
ncbi:MAG TPA: hypothetical protein VM261_29990 [Kofleriaceae bacterium]|nr:hypothetical protein [Kofleriaceae bacterium]